MHKLTVLCAHGTGAFMKLVRQLYDWVLSWGERRGAQRALFALSFAESSVFPIPPDPLLLGMGLGTPRKALRFAAICTAASVIGGLFGYWLGYAVQDIITAILQVVVDAFGGGGSFLGTPAAGAAIDAASNSTAMFGSHPIYQDGLLWKVSELYQGNAFLAVLGAALTPIPYKVFTVAGGYCSISLPQFIAASIIGRGGRFFAIALTVRFFGERAKSIIDRYFNWIISGFFLLLIAGFAVVKWVLA